MERRETDGISSNWMTEHCVEQVIGFLDSMGDQILAMVMTENSL